tara:strand:- start:263 stop:475 length:213 start_codon:yes stop_codon:yes gene_type:complete
MIDESEDIMQKAKTRNIVQTVLDYGVTDTQIYDIISLFAMEIENIDHVKQITSLVRSLQQPSKSPIITKE